MSVMPVLTFNELALVILALASIGVGLWLVDAWRDGE
jgi:hypothetical protein